MSSIEFYYKGINGILTHRKDIYLLDLNLNGKLTTLHSIYYPRLIVNARAIVDGYRIDRGEIGEYYDELYSRQKDTDHETSKAK
jgi:hypothetical protein